MPQSKSDIKNAYDVAAQSYASEFLAELQHKPLDQKLLKQFSMSLGAQASVVDLGCGPGHTTAHLASLGLRPVGVDLAPGMVAEAQKHFPNLEFVAADFFNLPYPTGSFAGCLAFYCIVHLQQEQLKLAFTEMLRVLEPNGLFFLSFHGGSDPVYVDDFLESGAALEFFPFPVNVVTTALAEAGFIDVDAIERAPYDTEYPSQRCYIFARKAVAA